MLEEQKERKLSFTEKVNLFMAYINTQSIPNGRSTIRFCDIAPNVTNSPVVVGVWLQSILQRNEQKILKECQKYQFLYPTAYQKIDLKIKIRNGYDIEGERLKLVMKFLETNRFLPSSNTLSFKDLSTEDVDDTLVASWFSQVIRYKLDWLKDMIKENKEIYPNAYQKIKMRIEKLEIKRKASMLSYENRVEVIIKYLNIHDFPDWKSKMSFQDLEVDCTDDALVISWINRQWNQNIEQLICECNKYQMIYPIGYQKMMMRIEKNKSLSDQVANYLSYEEKMQVYMKYVETHDVLRFTADLRFCDIGDGVKDESNVGHWFIGNLSKNLSKFIETYSQYQTIYPNAYQKISFVINNSSTRLKKNRLLFLEQLKVIRNSLEQSSNQVSSLKLVK